MRHRDDERFAQTLVTMDGDRLEPSGVVVGGSSDAVESALLQQKREIRELEGIVHQLEEDFAAVRARQQGQAERLREVDEGREASETEVLEGEKRRLAAAQRVDTLRESGERFIARITSVTGERAQIVGNLETRRREHEEFEQEREQLRELLPRLEEDETRRGVEIEALAERSEKLAAELTEAKVALASWQEQCNALASTRDRLERQAASERDRSRRLEEAAVESERRIADLDKAITEMVDQHGQLLEEHKLATTTKHDASEACDAINVRVSELEVGIRNLRQDLDEERERLGEVDLGLRELNMEREHLVGDIRDRFDAEIHTLLTDHHDRPTPTAEHRDRIKHLKRVLSRMGEVNLTAITEFEEVSKRHEYLTGQQADLEEAIEKLQAAIDKINVTTRERFRETFEQVNAYFQKLFPRLFNGGRAELVMTDPSNLLETGIDILAQPPGKKVSSLELLSGGEKALTAVSLIFGIFLMKSSPFCLLDEVDAPLDDANVGRFCDMVRELSERTQFIIITHNKRTMEIADRLYGVTMQQRGISKLVSVNMRRTVSEASIS
jgi:chromosome segregation protein